MGPRIPGLRRPGCLRAAPADVRAVPGRSRRIHPGSQEPRPGGASRRTACRPRAQGRGRRPVRGHGRKRRRLLRGSRTACSDNPGWRQARYSTQDPPLVAPALGQPPPAATPAGLKPGTATKARRWWPLPWTHPLLAALAAAAVTAAAFLGATLFESAPALAATFTLHPKPGQVGSATAVARSVTGGFQVTMDLKHLAKLGPGQFYEC